MRDPVSRRDFLRTVAAGAAGVALGLGGSGNRAEAQRPGVDVNSTLKGFTLTDQYEKPFVADAALGGKPYLLIQGFLHCRGQCPRIRGNTGEVRTAIETKATELENQGKKAEAEALRNMPVVWIDTLPEPYGANRGDANQRQECVENAYKYGLWQRASDAKNFPADESSRENLGSVAYVEGESTPVTSRLLHVLFPESEAKADELQLALKANFTPAERESHGSRITVVGADGLVKGSWSGLITSADEKKTMQTNVVNASVEAVQAQLSAQRDR